MKVYTVVYDAELHPDDIGIDGDSATRQVLCWFDGGDVAVTNYYGKAEQLRDDLQRIYPDSNYHIIESIVGEEVE